MSFITHDESRCCIHVDIHPNLTKYMFSMFLFITCKIVRCPSSKMMNRVALDIHQNLTIFMFSFITCKMIWCPSPHMMNGTGMSIYQNFLRCFLLSHVRSYDVLYPTCWMTLQWRVFIDYSLKLYCIICEMPPLDWSFTQTLQFVLS